MPSHVKPYRSHIWASFCLRGTGISDSALHNRWYVALSWLGSRGLELPDVSPDAALGQLRSGFLTPQVIVSQPPSLKRRPLALMGESGPAPAQGSSLLSGLVSEPLPTPLATVLTGPMPSLLASLDILTPCHSLTAMDQKSLSSGAWSTPRNMWLYSVVVSLFPVQS